MRYCPELEATDEGRDERSIIESGPSCHELQGDSKSQLSGSEQFCVVGRRTNSISAVL